MVVVGAAIAEEGAALVGEVEEEDVEGAGDAGGRFLAPEQAADVEVEGGSWGSMVQTPLLLLGAWHF